MLRISVVIPTYNCAAFIGQAIESAIGSDISEVIVVDDGSTDDTAERVTRLAHSKLRYVKQANQGVSAARNQGIELAQGELIAFLDADDWFLPDKLTRQAALFTANPQLGLVQSGWQRVSESGQHLANVTPWQSIPDLTLEAWLQHKPVLPSALMVRRDWLRHVNGFDPDLNAAEDVDLVCRLALAGCPAAWLTEVAVSYRQRARSAMGDSRTQARDLKRFLDKFFGNAQLPPAIRLLEKTVRYNTLVWAAWYLYHTGHIPEMAQYLRQAWAYSPYRPLDTVLHWTESFEQLSTDWQEPLVLTKLLSSQEWQGLTQWVLAQA